jgi:diguanylate cyclase (GGDEF)-like protein
MQNTIVQYVALACAGFAAAVGVASAQMARGGVRARSARIYSLAAGVVFVGCVAGVLTGNDVVLFGGISAGLLLVAVGLVVQAKEGEAFERIAAEQRVDVTSGLPNERLFHERLLAEHSRTKRTNQRYSIAVFEIDDYALLSDDDKDGGMKLLAEALNESIRNTDTLGRIGDHQVGVLLVDTLAEGAAIGCDRACERFFFQSCGHSDAAHVTRPLTTSVGIACFDDDIVDPHHVVDNAKLALKRLRDELRTGIKVYDRNEFTRPADSGVETLGSA